ncbi:cation diffusion facilitator family transporter [Stenotrophomonas sp.]|uniref:cation diffusion facilitator family transporter n=1 Tax=Stenotrophomonas sp. TaxID=69392 RepID=UPI0028AAE336|nr:cation diffusion facilitator family transporter [Stenotrophomonas sp.]
MSHDHNHLPSEIRHEKPLWWALGLTTAYLVVEVIGAFWTNSLALLSDAAHMATDAIGLMIALTAVRLSRRPPDAKRTYGYARLEALGAVANGLLLFGVGIYILFEAVQRFQQPQAIASTGMMWVAAFGLVVNLIAMRLLSAGSGESLNVKGAYLEVWSDMLGSVAVIAGGLIIHFTGWTLVDPILAVLIGLWVLPRTWVLLRDAINVLLEGVPKGVVLADIEAALRGHAGVAGIHDLHVWALASSTPALTVHVVMHDGQAPDVLRRQLADLLHERFDIDHVTVQVEADHCGDDCADKKAGGGHDDHEGHAHGPDDQGHHGHVHR